MKEYEGYGTAFEEHRVHTFNLEAGKTYYLWGENYKTQIYSIKYTYEKEVELEEYTASVKKGSNLVKGTNYGDDVVNITVLEESVTEKNGEGIYYKSSEKATIDGTEYSGAFVGQANPTTADGGKLEEGKNIVPGLGTAYKFTVTQSTTLKIAAKFGSTNNKAYYFVTVDKDGNSSFVGGSNDIKTANTVLTFQLEPDNTYYYYVAGSKATVYDITYTYMRGKAGRTSPC